MTLVKRLVRSLLSTSAGLSLVAASACGSSATSPTATTTAPVLIKVSLVGRVTRADGTPMAGVFTSASVVSSNVKQVMSGLTDADGRFSLGNIDLLSINQLMFSATAPGYAPFAQMLSPTSSTALDIQVKLTAYARVPLQGSLESLLQPTDPATYVGEPYDSAFLWQSQFFYFEAPADSDLDVALTWSPAGNAKLVMSASDAGGSWSQDGLQRIVIPKGSTGRLFVGQSYDGGKLTQPVNFRLTGVPLR